MDRGQTNPIPHGDLNWADRSDYWQNYREPKPGRKKKFKYREPLILCGHGIRIRVDRDTLLIRSGFTHYPQKPEEIRFFPGDPNLPDRIIILDGNGGVSFDALNWMSDQKIALIQLNWRGQVVFSGNSGSAANPRLVVWQSEIRNSEKGLQLTRKLIAAKFDACSETLLAIFGQSDSVKSAVAQISFWKKKVLNSRESNSPGRILGFEGMAASIYYRTWHELPLRWAGLWKKPVPATWSKVGARSMSWQRESNNARHPINAMLNYGYALLITAVRTEIVSAGFDPSVGIAHRREWNRISFVYDLMEPLRPVVDRQILEFALSNTFTPADFTINRQGACRLNPQLAKAVTAKVGGIKFNMAVQRLLNSLMK